MTSAKIVLGIMAFSLLILSGCSGNSDKDNPGEISDESLYEFRIGTTVIDPLKTNLIAYDQENLMTLKFSNFFSIENYQDSISAKIWVSDITQGWTNTLGTSDIFRNGQLNVVDTDFGSNVMYSATHPLSYLLRINPTKPAELIGNYSIFPGDEVRIAVQYLTAEFQDADKLLLQKDAFTTYCSKGTFPRSVGADDLNTDGQIENIYLGAYKITDTGINTVPLDQVYDITLDFSMQLNPYKFRDLLDYRIIVNNVFSGRSFTIDKSMLDSFGNTTVVDYVEGVVQLKLNKAISDFNELFFLLPGDRVASPGDLMEIQIDYFVGEDILENQFNFQNKKFKLFYLGSPPM